MRITFYGGANEVGRSCVEVRHGRKRLLLDAGVKIGRVEEHPLLPISSVPTHIVITHSHLDHAAYLPHIFRRRSRKKVYMTKPTRDLIQLMIADYMRVSRAPFDNSKVLSNILSAARVVEYNERERASLEFSLHEAGHILGSAQVLVREGPRLIYTGDINTRKSRIVKPVEKGLRARYLVVESTYGDRDLPPIKDEMKRMISLIQETVDRGGKVLIPSFAVGRAQEIILALDSYMRNGTLDPLPIFIDGMIKKALRIFRHNVVYARRELQLSILQSDYDPFKSRYVFVPSRLDRRDAIDEASIVITTSGMLKGGPVMTYLRAMASDPNNLLLFVGYQAPGTPGRDLLDGKRVVDIDGEKTRIRMRVDRVQLSAHADRKGLLEYIRSVKGLETVFVVHGEEGARRSLAKELEGYYEVILPRNGETFTLS